MDGVRTGQTGRRAQRLLDQSSAHEHAWSLTAAPDDLHLRGAALVKKVFPGGPFCPGSNQEQAFQTWSTATPTFWLP